MRKRVIKLVKKPLPVNTRMKQIRQAVEDEINNVLRKHQTLRDKATTGWSSKNKPSFPKFVKYSKSPSRKMQFGVMVKAPNARGASISVYRMNNDKRHGDLATKVRYAFMGSGYMSKTRPQQFGLFGKGGQPLRFGKKGLPGIKARLWDETANEILQPMMTKAIRKSYRKGFKQVQGKTINAR